jgi:hypothetical protein
MFIAAILGELKQTVSECVTFFPLRVTGLPETKKPQKQNFWGFHLYGGEIGI